MYENRADARVHVVKLNLSDEELQTLEEAARVLHGQKSTVARELSIKAIVSQLDDFKEELVKLTASIALLDENTREHRQLVDRRKSLQKLIDACLAIPPSRQG